VLTFTLHTLTKKFQLKMKRSYFSNKSQDNFFFGRGGERMGFDFLKGTLGVRLHIFKPKQTAIGRPSEGILKPDHNGLETYHFLTNLANCWLFVQANGEGVRDINSSQNGSVDPHWTTTCPCHSTTIFIAH
jgi:hypothetical protein